MSTVRTESNYLTQAQLTPQLEPAFKDLEQLVGGWSIKGRKFIRGMMAFVTAAIAGTGCTGPLIVQVQEDAEPTFESGYADVNGINLYYEIHGTGEPLILLHGGVGGSVMFGSILPALSEDRQVITVDLQAHGRTGDIDRPFRYESLADDIAALIEHLGFTQVDLMGYSLGGQVALQTTIRHPELIRRLVLVSVPFKRDGSYPEVLAAFEQMGAATGQFMRQSPLAQIYPDVDWAMLFTKLGDLLREDFDWSEDVAAITTPTMLIFADADSIRTTHMMEFYGLLGGGQRDAGQDGSGRPITQLAILPNATHYNIIESPALPSTVTRFLEGPLPQAE